MLKGLKYGVPKWLADALGVYWSKGITVDLRDVPGFDHVRTYKSRVVISQPYEAKGAVAEVLAKLHGQGIRIRLWGVSPYFPGRTFSLLLWRPEDEELAREIEEVMAKAGPETPKPSTHSEWA